MYGSLGANCDNFYVRNYLFFKLDLEPSRETLLHFFDQLRKEFPRLAKLRRRRQGSLVLEEDSGDSGSQRWLRVEANGLQFGCQNPGNADEVFHFGSVILEHAPYHLTFSKIDFDRLEVVYGFELDYCGNHDQLVAETFFSGHPMGQLLLGDDAACALDVQPFFGIALNETCDMQAYVEVKSRTSTFEIRSGEYERQPITVLLTLRKYWTGAEEPQVTQIYRQLHEHAGRITMDFLIPTMVNPLAHAIAGR